MVPSSPGFARSVEEEVKNFRRCYQCSMCSDGCPVAFSMDYFPNELIALLRHGRSDVVLKSRAIWTCVSCHTCATRCPNDIDIVHFMDLLRRRSLQDGVNPSMKNTTTFHRTFVETLLSGGRVDTFKLLTRYQLKTGDMVSSIARFREQTRLAVEMVRKGKLRINLGAKGVGKGRIAAVQKPAGTGTVRG